MNEEYEKIEFKTWQELAKFVIDGGDVYVKIRNSFLQLAFNGEKFNADIVCVFNFCYTKKQKTIEELIKIKPRLCRVWDDDDDKGLDIIHEINENNYRFRGESCPWKHAEMLTDEEIKEFLND